MLVVTDAALYRSAGRRPPAPRLHLVATYANDDGTSKPGQTEIGSGTTPTVTPTGPWVAITDNANPIDIVVYRQ